MTDEEPKPPRIEDLERLLEQGVPLEILPNGEVRVKEGPPNPPHPLTFKTPLGGEY